MMGFKRYFPCTAMAVVLAAATAAPSLAQVAPQSPPAAAGALDPAAEAAPRAAAPATPDFQLQDGVIATVNDSVITGFDLRQRMLLVIAMTQVQPTNENLPSIQREALNAIIDERLQGQEIGRFEELTVSDQDVAEEIAAMAQEAGTSAESYLGFLSSVGIRQETLIMQVRTGIGWSRLVGGRFNSRARPSQAQVQETLRQLADNASRPQYLIGEIYIDATRVGGQQTAMNGAASLIQQLVQGAPFQAVAQQFSGAPSSVRGGDAGWVVQGAYPDAVQQALDQLDAGQLSRPIPVDGGVYIIYMRDKRSGAATSMVSLKQVMVELPETATEAEVTAATQRLEALRSQLTCDNILARATSEQGLLGSDLGETEVENLAPQFQQIARSGEIGSISSPVRTPLGIHLVAVCNRRSGAPDLPSAQQVEGQLLRQNLAQMGRRYMRDLRSDALIETR